MTRLAITGGTGFVGSHLLRLAHAQGIAVRALTRRPQADYAGVTWVTGTLENSESLERLADGADAIVHVAGVVKGKDRAGFAAGNEAGTAATVAAAQAVGTRRFVHVSSLAAREPGLSDYGWSKAASEAVVETAGLDSVIVRPPAIYGPGDHEMLELFRAARMGIVPLPPRGRLSIIHAEDLARLLLSLATTPGVSDTFEPDDGRPGGWSHMDMANAIGSAMGRKVLGLPTPAALIHLGARADEYFRGANAKLTRDRARYFCHPDWVVSDQRRPPQSLWRPEIDTGAGLADTAAWYRKKGWL